MPYPRSNTIKLIVGYVFGLFVLAGLGWSVYLYTVQAYGSSGNPAAVRSAVLSVDDGDMMRGTKTILGTAAKPGTKLQLSIDGEKVPAEAVMNKPVLLTLEADGVEGSAGYKDSIWVNGKLAHVFETDVSGFAKVTIPIPAAFLQPGDNAVTFRAGGKLSAEDTEGPHDAWRFRNVLLELSDGTVLDAPDYKTAAAYSLGSDGPGSVQSPAELQRTFHYTLKEEKYRSVYYSWDTAKTTEGSHRIELRTEQEGRRNARTVQVEVDNTPPQVQITSPMEGKTYRNKVAVAVHAEDERSGTATIVAKLDGKVIEAPAELLTAELAVGKHRLEVTTADKAGNETASAVTFQVLKEMPLPPAEPYPADRSKVRAGPVPLSVQVSDPAQDKLTVSFYKAQRYDLTHSGNLLAYANTADREPPLQKQPEGERALTPQERAAVSVRDGQYLTEDAKDRFPYHRFTFEVKEGLPPDAEVVWTGHSLPGRRVTLYVWNETKAQWQDLDSNQGTEDFTLRGKLTGELVHDGTVDVLIQDRIPSTGEYDFAFLWMTDTQYYSESFPNIYDQMTHWTVDHWKERKFQYAIHTGDIVNNWNSKPEWENASRSMKILDDARIPYGVAAGNHDVAYDAGNYDEFWKYFGKERFVGQPTFGGDLNNNRDHYDLVSAQGNDFVIVYLGWLIDQKSFDWANSILQKYADRNAIIATHEYLKPNKAYFGQGKEIWDKLVVPNPNVFMVLGGHNPGVANNLRKIGDRTVVEMLSDYQNGPEGGQGFMRFLQFDLQHKRLLVNTYSPYLNQWDFFKPQEEELVFPLQLKPVEKQVATDYVGIYARTEELIGTSEPTASGSRASVPYPGAQPEQSYFWYAVAKDEYGGRSVSDVFSFEAGQ